MIANRKARFYSMIIDYLVIVGYCLFLLAVSLVIYSLFFNGKIPELNEVQGNLVSFSTLLFPVFLYFSISENSKKHSTIGKRKIGLVVRAVNGTLNLKQVIVRNIVKLLPWQIAHMAMFHVIENNSKPTTFFYGCLIFVYIFPIANIACMIYRKDRRALHDLIAGTLVTVKDQ